MAGIIETIKGWFKQPEDKKSDGDWDEVTDRLEEDRQERPDNDKTPDDSDGSDD